MKYSLKITAALFFLLLGLQLSAQIYPVQVTPVYNTPYSSRISDYASSFDEKLRLIVNPTDITINNRPVRLKLYIQGNGINARSNDYVQGQNPLYINGGDLQTFTNLDFGALFRLENLQGISASQYASPLPDGLYTVCFEMYDFVTGQKLSSKSCTTLYLQLNDPPLLNIPTRNEQVAAADFPNILFTWTPRQLNATNVSYQFELKEIQDPNIDPQFGFQMSPMLHEETLFATALVYDLGKPALIPGKRYAWRVRAVSTSGISENNVFKNNGYSEIFWFKYASTCPAPAYLLSEAQNATKVKLLWQGNAENTKYHVQYKKKNIAGAEWFSTYTLNTQIILADLEHGQEYEFRVGAACDPAGSANLSYVYSGINVFVMPDQGGTSNSGYNCGINPTINITNQAPLTNLIVNEIFTAGDFPVKVLEVLGNGSYTGRGYIIVPYLADTKLAVEFSNITINTDYQLVSGIVETTYNPDWSNVSDLEDLGNNGAIETHEVPFVIGNITVNSAGDTVVSGGNGEQVTIPGGANTQITDSEGNIYTVDENGNISGPEKLAPGGAPTPANTDGVSASGESTGITAEGITVKFTKASQNVYGFDEAEANDLPKIRALYKKLGNDYYLPFKSVLNKNEGGTDDSIIATVDVADAQIPLDSIVFKTQKGIKIESARNGNVFTLTLKGNISNTEEEVLAVIKQGAKYKVAGAFKLVYLVKRETAKIVLINAGGAIPDAGDLQAYLNGIYDDAGASFEVVQTVALDINPFLHDTSKISSGESGIAAQYSDEQQAINAAIKGTPAFAQYPNAYYLVITNKAPTTAGEKGLMPLGRQFGYIYSGGHHTISHELGHGIFQLKHPFSETAYQTPVGATNWLMDYSVGTKLPHVHWKQIQSPACKFQ